MTSYFRNIFGGQAASTPASNPSKTHSRSRSEPSPQGPPPPPNPKLNYIYAPPATAPSVSSSSHTSRERRGSYSTARANAPSPLRYATYNSSAVKARSQTSHSTGSQQVQQPTSRVPMYRSSSHKAAERPPPYPIYNPTGSYSSIRSASSTSIHPGSTTSVNRPTPTRTSSSGSVAPSEPSRSALKQNHTWHGGSKSGPQAHVSFLNPNRQPTLHMHPLLAYSRLHHAPIFYDITYTPSSRTVLDRHTHNPVPTHTLSQPATDPPTLNQLVLKSDKFPWPIVAASSMTKSTGARFYLGGSSRKAGTPVTNLDVLYAVHSTLSSRITQEEWEALGHGSRAQRKITRAYEKRCIKMGGGWDGGVRRIDFLGEKTRLVGVEVDKSASNGGAGKLVFSKP